MSNRALTNSAASVRQRLLNLARTNGRSFNEIVQHYALERWLYRLSCSEYAGCFVLKGALMLAVWEAPVARPTRDIDLLAYTSNDLDAVRQVVSAICQTPVQEDGIVYNHESVVTVRIAEDADYEGVRATFRGLLGTVRCPIQVDLGFSDVVTPAAIEIEYPTIMKLPAPRLQAYNRETAIAEKLEAMLKIGELNSRMKDFFDIWLLSTKGQFDGPALADAVRATFAHRGTILDASGACFSEAYATQHAKAAQWQAFVRRSALVGAPPSFSQVWQADMSFLHPVAEAIEHNRPFDMVWPAGGPWRSRG